MTQVFTNDTPVTIDPGSPNTVTSSIDVQGLGDEVVQNVTVRVDIDHTWTGDLIISLLNPAGQRVILVDRRGGRRDDFRYTVFDETASVSILNAIPPFEGTFQPEGNLDDFRDRPANGIWTLEVRDRAYQDGGTLRRWDLTVDTKSLIETAFSIDLRFLGGLTTAQQDAFDAAARRWAQIILSDLPSVEVNGEVVDNIVIEAQGKPIDGPSNTLGMAGPTFLRNGSLLPAWGIMYFDTDDLDIMEGDGSLVRVIAHEMAHVLGLGSIWSQDYLGLLQGAGTNNPRFVGPNAMREFATLQGEATPIAVPVANTGGPGTRDSHWREAVFVNELMTGWLDPGINPISAMTIASFEDLGYQVNYDVADPYSFPSALMPALVGMNARRTDHGGYGMILPTTPVVLPEDALVD